MSVIALEAFYMNATSEIQTMADYGGQDITAKGHKADEMRNITEPAQNQGAPTYRIPIDRAIKLVVRDANGSTAEPAAHLVPALLPSQIEWALPKGEAGAPPVPEPAPETAPPAPPAGGPATGSAAPP